MMMGGKKIKDAKMAMLKALANKMYGLEMDAWNKGEGEKPAPLAEAMAEQSPAKIEIEIGEEEEPEMNEEVKALVKSFFQPQEEVDEDVIPMGFVKRQQAVVVPEAMTAMASGMDSKPAKRRGRPRKMKG